MFKKFYLQLNVRNFKNFLRKNLVYYPSLTEEEVNEFLKVYVKGDLVHRTIEAFNSLNFYVREKSFNNEVYYTLYSDYQPVLETGFGSGVNYYFNLQEGFTYKSIGEMLIHIYEYFESNKDYE